MKTFVVDLVITMPDNFDENGVAENIEETLLDNPDIEHVQVLTVLKNKSEE